MFKQTFACLGFMGMTNPTQKKKHIYIYICRDYFITSQTSINMTGVLEFLTNQDGSFVHVTGKGFVATKQRTIPLRQRSMKAWRVSIQSSWWLIFSCRHSYFIFFPWLIPCDQIRWFHWNLRATPPPQCHPSSLVKGLCSSSLSLNNPLIELAIFERVPVKKYVNIPSEKYICIHKYV